MKDSAAVCSSMFSKKGEEINGEKLHKLGILSLEMQLGMSTSFWIKKKLCPNVLNMQRALKRGVSFLLLSSVARLLFLLHASYFLLTKSNVSDLEAVIRQ